MASSTVKQPASPWWKEWHGPIGNLPGTREDYVGINAVDPVISYSPHAAHLWNGQRTATQIFAARHDVQFRPAPTRDILLEMFKVKKLIVETLRAAVRLPSDAEMSSAYGRCAPVPLDQGPIWFPRRRDFQGQPRAYGISCIQILGESLLQIARSQNVNKDPHGLTPLSCENIVISIARWVDDTLRTWFNFRLPVGQPSIQDYFTKVAKGEEVAHAALDMKFADIKDEQWNVFNDRTQLFSPEGEQFTINSENPTFDPEQTLPEVGDRFVVLYDGRPYIGTVTSVNAVESKAILNFGPGTPPGEYDLGELLPIEEWEEELAKAGSVSVATATPVAATPTSSPSGV